MRFAERIVLRQMRKGACKGVRQGESGNSFAWGITFGKQKVITLAIYKNARILSAIRAFGKKRFLCFNPEYHTKVLNIPKTIVAQTFLSVYVVEKTHKQECLCHCERFLYGTKVSTFIIYASSFFTDAQQISESPTPPQRQQ